MTVGDLFWIKTFLGINLIILIVIMLYLFGFFNSFKIKTNINSISKWKSGEFAPTALIAVDSNFRIVSCNKSAEKLFLTLEPELINSSIFDLIIDSDQERFQEDLVNASKGINVHVDKFYTAYLTEKKHIPIKVGISCWKEEGKFYYTISFKNIETAIREKEETLKELDIYRIGEKLANYGAWMWDLVTDEVFATDNAVKIWEMDDVGLITYENFIKRIYYEDKEKFVKSLEEGIKNKKQFINVFRVLGRDGQIIHLENRTDVVTDNNGTVVKLLGTTTKH